MTRAESNRRRRKRDREHRFALRLRGLTSRRTIPKQRIWPKHLFFGCKTETERNKIRRRILRAENIAAGLNWQGKPRQYRKFRTHLARLTPSQRRDWYNTEYQRLRRAKINPTKFDHAWQTFRQTTSVPSDTLAL